MRRFCLRVVTPASLLVIPAGCTYTRHIVANDPVQEPEAFMAAYAEDLRNHDRQAIADRYDRYGPPILL